MTKREKIIEGIKAFHKACKKAEGWDSAETEATEKDLCALLGEQAVVYKSKCYSVGRGTGLQITYRVAVLTD